MRLYPSPNRKTVFQRIRNAIRTLIREELDSREKAQAKQVRELVSEMEDVLEKFNRVVAREAMRRSREMKKVLDGEQEPAAEEQPAANRKAALWQRARQLPHLRNGTSS